MTNTIDKCIWKITYEDSFKTKDGSKLKDLMDKKIYSPCKACKGYDKVCSKYINSLLDIKHYGKKNYK